MSSSSIWGTDSGIHGVAVALIVIGGDRHVPVAIIGIALGAAGLLFLIGVLFARGRCAATDSGGP